MHENNKSIIIDDEIDLVELAQIIWKSKVFIFVTAVLATLLSAYYALKLPDIYTSEVTLSPSEETAFKMQGQLGGLAALTGINLGGDNSSKSMLAIETLKTRQFISNFIDVNEIDVELMASIGWDKVNNKIVIDESVYDENKRTWIKVKNNANSNGPSVLDKVERFRSSMTIDVDKQTGLIRISFSHHSPYFSKEILDKLIYSINKETREKDLSDAFANIEYLNNKIKETSVSDLRLMLYSLIEEQTKKAMLASVRSEYIFKVIDPAVVPEKKSSPKRAIIVLIFGFGAFFLSTILVLLIGFIKK